MAVTPLTRKIADVLDIIHIPGAIFMLLIGLWPPMRLFVAWFWTIITALQIAFLGCPLMVLAAYLRGKPYSESWNGSFVYHFYKTHGAVPGIFLFAACLIGSIALTVLRIKGLGKL